MALADLTRASQYPNRNYPKIFDDAAVGAEAKKLFNEANVMLNHLITTRKLTASAVVHIWPANSVGDDIEVYADESRSQVVGRFHALRQQSQVALPSRRSTRVCFANGLLCRKRRWSPTWR